MAIYINKHKSNQVSSGGDTLQTEGNACQNHTTGATPQTYTVEDGVNYVTVWSTVAFTVKASPMPEGVPADFTAAYPANYLVQIPNVKIGTVITVTEI